MKGPNRTLDQTARRLLTHADAGVRSVAADVLTRTADPVDLAALTAMYGRSARDSFPDASLSALNAVLAIRRRSPAAAARVDREFLGTVPRPGNYLLRRWAETNWPEASNRWGPAYPLATGRTLQDYRDVARRFLVAPDSVARPHIFVETEQRGVLEIELFGPDAPLTVANFLRLLDRRFFDGNRWHRVVPNFVVQDGDPRGDGFGGPVAPSGTKSTATDTGSSPWSAWHSPVPIPGRVSGSSLYPLSPTSTAPIRCSGGWSATPLPRADHSRRSDQDD